MFRLGNLARGLADLVFAPICVACAGPIPANAVDRMVCSACWTRARPLPPPRCDRCWTPLPAAVVGTAAACRLCPELRPAIRAVRSAFLHEGPVRPLVHALKYRGWYGVAEPMGRRMAALPLPPDVAGEVELVVPVPLPSVRERHRGYNQAAVLAGAISALLGAKLEPAALQRTRSAGSQTTLHPGERRANVAGAFRASSNAAETIAAKHVLLVDDVWTTGATALSCADALLDAGARAVSVSTFARALPDLEERSRRAGQMLENHSR